MPNSSFCGEIGADAPLEAALNGFVDDDAVVDQHPDAHRQTEEGDQVEGPASQHEQGDGCQQAHRHRHRDHCDRPQLAQEEEEHGESDDKTGQGQAAETSQLFLHLLGGVEADHEAQAVGSEILLELEQAAPQPAAEIDKIGVLFLKDQKPDRRFAVDTEDHLLATDPEPNIGDVAELNRFGGADADLTYRDDAGGSSLEHHRRATVGVLGGAQIPHPLYRSGKGGHHLVRRHAEGGASVRVHLYCQLTRRTARGDDLSDPGHGRDPRLDPFVDKIAQGVAVGAAGDLHHHHKAAHEAEVLGAHRNKCVAGLVSNQISGDPLQLELAHLELGAGAEPHLELPAGTADLRPCFLHTIHLSDPSFEGEQQLALDHLGFGAGSVELHIEPVSLERRQQLDRDPPPSDDAEHHQGEEEHCRRNRAANREGEGVHQSLRAGGLQSGLEKPRRDAAWNMTFFTTTVWDGDDRSADRRTG